MQAVDSVSTPAVLPQRHVLPPEVAVWRVGRVSEGVAMAGGVVRRCRRSRRVFFATATPQSPQQLPKMLKSKQSILTGVPVVEVGASPGAAGVGTSLAGSGAVGKNTDGQRLGEAANVVEVAPGRGNGTWVGNLWVGGWRLTWRRNYNEGVAVEGLSEQASAQLLVVTGAGVLALRGIDSSRQDDLGSLTAMALCAEFKRCQVVAGRLAASNARLDGVGVESVVVEGQQTVGRLVGEAADVVEAADNSRLRCGAVDEALEDEEVVGTAGVLRGVAWGRSVAATVAERNKRVSN